MPAERDEFFDVALAEHDIRTDEIFQLDLEATPAADEDVAIIQPSRPAGENERRVLLYRDESGGVTWHFPQPANSPRNASPSGGPERFVVPLRTAAARESLAERRVPLGTRGIVTAFGRKLFRILILPLAPAALSRPLKFLVRQWEERNRSEILRTLTADDYKSAEAMPFTNWERLSGGRALLVVHGIFSSTRGMLSLLPRAQMEQLCERYQGRVLAYDHFSVSKSPEENATFFIEQLRARAGGRRFEFDVLTHSRGAIVARTLSERGAELSLDFAKFRKLFFVAPPNHGSRLADADRIVDMIDVFTNLITDFPDGPIAYSLDVLLAVLKAVAFAGIHELDGIRAMQPSPDGYIEKTLNGRTVDALERYACVTANYDPDPSRDNGFFTGSFANGVIDRVFGAGVQNDLVIPTRGAYERIGAQRRNIRAHTFTRGVWHTGFFANEETVQRAIQHFEGAGDDSGRIVMIGRSVASRMAAAVGGLFGATSPAIVLNSVRTSKESTEGVASDDPSLLRRQPWLDFHETVFAGETNQLTLRLEEVLTDPATALNLLLGAGVDAIDVTARVWAPGFDVKPAVQTMTLRRERVSEDETRVFALTAHDVTGPVRRTIYADFSIGTVAVGGVSHITTVVPPQAPTHPGEAPPIPAHFSMSAAQRERCDMKIVVSAMSAAADQAQPPFPLSVTSAIPGFSYDDDPLGAFTPKGGDVSHYLQTTLGPKMDSRPSPPDNSDTQQYEQALAKWNATMVETLRQFGMELWSWLPDLFRARYFEHVDQRKSPRSILINSVDMNFPWELVVPWRQTHTGREELAPLGQAHVIGRWRPGLAARPEPQHYRLNRVALLHPEYSGPFHLEGARQEAAELAAMFGATAFRVQPADEDTVAAQLLAASDVQLMHFCGHASFDPVNADQSYLELETGTLSALALATSKFTGARPFIVLNACSVGQASTVASRAGGFAAKCLNHGSSAVLAAYWPISDWSAKEFSLSLYRKLKAARSVGEALQELRSEHSGNPTYQAYTLVGDPLARLLF